MTDNTESINEKYSEKFGESDGLLQQHYDEVQRDLTLSDDERAAKAVHGHNRASAYLHKLETWRAEALDERVADLKDDLFSAATVNGFDGTVVREDANTAQLAALDATDSRLQLMAGRAADTKNSLLAKAVAAEAHARQRPDIAMGALAWLPKKLEAYTELVGIPDAETRADRVDRAGTSIPLPNMSRLRPTTEAQETAIRITNSERIQRARLEG
jgi:hypothetical protein